MLTRLIKTNLLKTKINLNINYIYNIGFILSISIIIQILTGVLLSIYFATQSLNNNLDFTYSLLNMMDVDVINGMFIKNIHNVNVSIIFILLYIHIFKSLYYSSYLYPRHNLFIIGCYLWFLLIIISFLGYSLPIGNMSLWAMVVITKLVTTIPYLGDHIYTLLIGSNSISSITLNRFYSFHYLLPFILLYLLLLHLMALHYSKGTNYIGINVNSNIISFNYLFTIKDLYTILIYLFILLYLSLHNYILFYEIDNKNIYNTIVTPISIVPNWYLLFYYSILRSISNKSIGIIFMLLSILVYLLLIFLNLTYIKSSYFKFYSTISLYLLVFVIIVILQFGSKPLVSLYILSCNFYVITYFMLLLIIIPLVNLLDNLLLIFLYN